MANKKKKNQSNQRREKKRKKKEIKRKEKIHHRTHDYSWKGYTHNQQEVAKRMKAGNYEMITGTGWGFLDKFFVFLFSIGFFTSLEIEGKGFERVMIPLAQLFMTYELKILLGINSVDKMTKHLFRDTALLMLIGFTARQIEEGFCNRDKGKREGPMIPDTVGDALSKLPEDEAYFILNSAISILAKKGFVKGNTFILDASDLVTTEKYEGAGRRTKKEKKRDKKGNEFEVEVTEYGFKLIIIKEVKSRIIVAAKVVQIQEHESPFTLELVKQAQNNMGKKCRIKLLLMDRGFLDGKTLWELKHAMKIDWIVPVRKNMDVAADIRSLRDVDDSDEIHRENSPDGKIEVVGAEGLVSYDEYGDEQHTKDINRKDFKANPVNAVMVTRWKGEDYKPGKEKVFITSLSVKHPYDIIKLYNLRALIENLAFRELKQGWLLTSYPQKTENAVRAHVLLTLVMFSAVNAYRTDLGQKLAEKGIRRWRYENASSIHKVVIFAEDYYAIFDIEEVMAFVGKPPKRFLRINPEKIQT